MQSSPFGAAPVWADRTVWLARHPPPVPQEDSIPMEAWTQRIALFPANSSVERVSRGPALWCRSRLEQVSR
jgi:hypothetical protein